MMSGVPALDIVPLTDPDDERLADYVSLTDVALRSRHEPEKGLYIAESSTVLGRALAAGHRPRSVLVSPRWLPDLTAMLEARDPAGEPVRVYVAEPPVLEAITGFHVHRGALAAMHRPPLPAVADVLAGARRVAVLEDVVDHTNVGADHSSVSHLGGVDYSAGAPLAEPNRVVDRTNEGPGDAPLPSRVVVLENIVDHTNVGAAMRACAAMGVDAVLVTPSCADPLYRRAIRVSMGTVFQVPWTRFEHWPHGPSGGAADGVDLLHELGYTVAALALDDESVSLDEVAANPPARLAMVFGTEGDGLKRQTVAACDLTVRIPMAGGVDSLNVASAVAVATWATRT